MIDVYYHDYYNGCNDRDRYDENCDEYDDDVDGNDDDNHDHDDDDYC